MTTQPQLRADARRNRERIITTARTVFAERGIEVPMEEIARAAGVGVGTLYRRFPDRDSLIRAVGVDVFQRVLDEARAATARESDPWQALTELLHRAADLRTVVRLSMLSPRAREILAGDPQAEAVRDEVLEILDRLVREAQDNGTMRRDVSSGDIGVMLSLVLQGVQGMPEDISSTVPARYLALMLDGLRAIPGSPLPGRPVTTADIARVRHTATGEE
jgi:AcrR family transcriptional regulator